MFQLKLHSLLVLTCRTKPWCGSCDLRPGKDARVSDGIIYMYACVCVRCACMHSFTAVHETFFLSVKAALWLQSAGLWVQL